MARGKTVIIKRKSRPSALWKDFHDKVTERVKFVSNEVKGNIILDVTISPGVSVKPPRHTSMPGGTIIYMYRIYVYLMYTKREIKREFIIYLIL